MVGFISRDYIKHAIKKNDEGLPIGWGIPDGVNTLIYTILKHFVGTPSNVSSRVSNYLNNLRCPTMSDYKWYRDVLLNEWCFGKIATSLIGKKSLLMACLLSLLIR